MSINKLLSFLRRQESRKEMDSRFHENDNIDFQIRKDIRAQYPELLRKPNGTVPDLRTKRSGVVESGLSPLRAKLPTPDLFYAIGLPPEKAIEFFKSKGYTFSWDWHDTWQEAHAKAFTVAKVMRMDILQDIRDMVQKSLDEGITFQQFRKELEPKLKAKGWWGRRMIMDEHPPISPLDKGGIKGGYEVQLGSPHRLKTIYQTNLQTAYNAGRWKEQMENVDNRPYLQYVAVMDSRTRPHHKILNGKVFRADDPFWDTHYPPLGFNCRCRVRALSDKNLKDRGLIVENSKGKLSEQEVLVSKKTGELRPVTVYRDPLTGEKIAPDVGFNYNPGKAAWQPDLDRYDYDVAKKSIEGGLTGPDFKAFYEGNLKGTFAVAVLSEDYKKAIKSKSQVVNLSDKTLAKNKETHPEIKVGVYQKLPDIIAKAQLIVQDRENTFVFLRIGNKIYYGAVKTTQTGKANFLTSLRLARKSDIETIKKKGKVLKDEL
jgi:SPP1 gp7 family putative phage head morphogenesis protein